ncbi:MAG: twin-arginine translocation signal domain-containing protein [Phycisphaerae bacterium]|nr:twin-arginine translocation signal domain-containing protein [Phycisphaerae bacterium]
MSENIDRRNFMKQSAVAGAAASLAFSLEEKALLAKDTAAGADKKPARKMSMGKIGNLELSRLVCGGNLISGYAHSRDLIYVSPLLKHYFTDEKILDTWQICEENGINSCTIYSGDPKAVELFGRYKKERGGKMVWLAQTAPQADTIEKTVDEAMANGAAAIYLVGNMGDRWSFDNRMDLIDKFVNYVKKQGVPAGVAGHALDTPIAVESAGIDVDFHFKTLHSNEYWSRRRPDQTKAVIESYNTDNYWDLTPEQTIEFMKEVKKPWMAYKVLAAGAIRPQDGFKYAFENGADFACVGMFDWQVAEDVRIADKVVAECQRRPRAWMA